MPQERFRAFSGLHNCRGPQCTVGRAKLQDSLPPRSKTFTQPLSPTWDSVLRWRMGCPIPDAHMELSGTAVQGVFRPTCSPAWDIDRSCGVPDFEFRVGLRGAAVRAISKPTCSPARDSVLRWRLGCPKLPKKSFRAFFGLHMIAESLSACGVEPRPPLATLETLHPATYQWPAFWRKAEYFSASFLLYKLLNFSKVIFCYWQNVNIPIICFASR